MDKHGNEGRAHVEFAPFQKIPREQRKADPKQGTIEEGRYFLTFGYVLLKSGALPNVTRFLRTLLI